MEALQLESLLQAAAVEQFLCGDSNPVSLLQQVSDMPTHGGKGYHNFIDDLPQAVPNSEDSSSFPDNLDFDDISGKKIASCYVGVCSCEFICFGPC